MSKENQLSPNPESNSPSHHSNIIKNSLDQITSLLTSKALKHWLDQDQRNVVVTNITFAILATYSGINLVQVFYSPSQIFNYREIKIEERDLNVLCGDPTIYLPRLREKGYDQSEYNFIDQGAVLLEGGKVENIYPVFRWVCQYELIAKNQINLPQKPGKSFVIIVNTGLDMDRDLCQRKYEQDNLIKATYHDYNDPNSWYCTNTEFQ